MTLPDLHWAPAAPLWLLALAGAVALLRAFTEVEGNHCVQRSGPAAAGTAKV